MRKRKDTGTIQKKETGKNYRIYSAKQTGEQTGLSTHYPTMQKMYR